MSFFDEEMAALTFASQVEQAVAEADATMSSEAFVSRNEDRDIDMDASPVQAHNAQTPTQTPTPEAQSSDAELFSALSYLQDPTPLPSSNQDEDEDAEMADVYEDSRRIYEIECILDHEGRGEDRRYLVKWQGCGPEQNSWVNRDDFGSYTLWEEYDRSLKRQCTKADR
jgi:hypothetical protein